MKHTFTKLFRRCAIVAFTCFAGMAQAATFTAVSSGTWSSASTWSGGVAPGGSIGGFDNVVINSGVTVTLDMNVEQTSILSYIQVNGTLNSASNMYLLDINNGDLSGNGTLNLHKLRFGTLGGMSFTGTANIDNLWNNNIGLSLVSQLVLDDTLFLDAGSLTLGTGGFLTLSSASVIRVDDGSITLGSGTVNNSNNYEVMYVGSGKNTGFELSGSGLGNVWINLDDNTETLTFTGTNTINGDLHQQTGMINIGGSLMLMGDYIASSGAMLSGSPTSNLHIMSNAALTSQLVFDGSADELNDLVIDNNGAVVLGSDLTINGNLQLSYGAFNLSSGTLAMANGSDVIIGDGGITMGSGSFDGSATYDVTYNGSLSTTSGIELSGLGLRDLTVDFDNEEDSLELSANLIVNGTLNMNHGHFALNGHHLTLNGSYSGTSGAWFSGDAASNLTIATMSANNDTLWFNTNSHNLADLTINTNDGSYITIGNELRVENLVLTQGGVAILEEDLWINSTGTVSGANEDNYVMTMGHGNLNMRINVAAAYQMFPVGTDEGYAPVSLQQNSGIDRYFRVHVMNGVWSAGTVGDDNSTTESVVNKTWDISLSTPGSVDVNMMMMWDASMEVNGFDRTDAYISHYTSGAWDSYAASAAVAVGSMFQIERENVTSLSPFAVVDEAATVSVAEINEQPMVQMYPNPVRDLLTCVVNINETTTVDLVDLTGKVLYSKRLEGTAQQMTHTINFNGLPNGVYFIRYNSPSSTTSYKVVKS